MIEISKLTPEDVGRFVLYTDGVDSKEFGRIKSWNEHYIFVVFNCNDHWNKFFHYRAKSTRPENLKFAEESDFLKG